MTKPSIEDQAAAIEKLIAAFSLPDDERRAAECALRTIRLVEQHRDVVRAAIRLAIDNPAVAAVLAAFPDARIEGIKAISDEGA